MSDLWQLYQEIQRPSEDTGEGRRFSVRAIPERSNQFVARSANDKAAILLDVVGQGRARAPIVLQRLRVAFNVASRLTLPGGERSTRATVIECLSDDPTIEQYFFLVGERLLDQLGHDAGDREIITSIDALVELFQRLTRSPTGDAQGLFAELLLIDLAPHPDTLVAAWHIDQFGRFDFAHADLRLEVKSSGTRSRKHHFSLEQCDLDERLMGCLISTFVEEIGTGLSLATLMNRIDRRLSHAPELVAKFHAVIAAVLGSALPFSLTRQFDEQLALGSMQFYDLREVPAIRSAVPPEVTSVHFASDLGGVGSRDLAGAVDHWPVLSELLME